MHRIHGRKKAHARIFIKTEGDNTVESKEEKKIREDEKKTRTVHKKYTPHDTHTHTFAQKV